MKLIIEDIGNYRFAIIIKNDSGRSYNFVEWADSLQDGKSTAREYYDSDFYHRTHSEYWLYDTKKHRAYLPQGFSSTDQQFDNSLPIYKEDDEGRYELLVDYVDDKIYGMKESVQPDGNSVRKAWAEKLGVDQNY